jgi:hypothetical protein
MESIRGGKELAAGLALSQLGANDLWVRYFALTGRYSRQNLLVYLAGETEWSAGEHDMAAQALNEYFTDQGMDHPVSYADEL